MESPHILNTSTKRNLEHDIQSIDDDSIDGLHHDFGAPLKKVASSKSSTATPPNKNISASTSATTLNTQNKISSNQSNKPRPYVCSICTRAFARLEHLKRHERSHTNEKPFQCAACGRCFARRDLVLRHQQKLHAYLPTNNRNNIQRKGRAQKSDARDGEIVRDYLNDNINIVRNNTSVKLPLANNSNSSFSSQSPLNNNPSFSSFQTSKNIIVHSPVISNSTSSNIASSISPMSDASHKSTTNNNLYNLHHPTHHQTLTNPLMQNQMDLFNSNILGTNMTNSVVYNSPNSINGLMFSPSVYNQNSHNIIVPNNPSLNSKTSPHENITPESQKDNHKKNNPQSTTSTKLTNIQDDNLSEELDSDLDSDHEFDNPKAMYSTDITTNNNDNDNNNNNNTNINTNDNNTNNVNDLSNNENNPQQESENNFRNHRHASFSAAASSSYTGLPPDNSIPHDKNMEELDKEAPQQVNFSSPQLTFKPNSELGYLDLDILENIDLNDIGLDLSSINFTHDPAASLKQQLGHTSKADNSTNNSAATINNNSSNHNTIASTSMLHRNTTSDNKTLNDHPLNNSNSSFTTNTNSHINSGSEDLSPQEINLQRVFSNPQNGVALQKVLSHPRSGPALQKVLSHPNSDVALQKVLSHPEPNSVLQKVLSHPSDTEWFNEFINAPIETNFPVISDHIGFTDTTEANTNSSLLKNHLNNSSTVNNLTTTASTTTNSNDNHNVLFNNPDSNILGNILTESATSPSNISDLKNLFRSRQIDLSKHIPHPYQNPTIPGRCSESVRSHIMSKYNLKQQQFPQLDDLNHYLALYELEFSKYFPFVHIPSFKIDDNLEQIPLMLSMAAIGALYSFHARNSSTLFNFSRFLIHNFMEVQMKLNQFNDIPLHITQSLVLHMFLGMFHNDSEITKLISRQLNSLVSLIKTTKLDMPLESLLLPPAINFDLTSSNNYDLLDACHKYFILAQSRIRTIHVLHYITVLYGCLTDSKVEMSANDIEAGSPCAFESLWNAKNFNEWIDVLKEKNITVNSKFSLIRLCNGHSYKDLWRGLQNLSLDKDIGLRGMLSLLMSINEYIHMESMNLEHDIHKTDGTKLAEWRMDQRPYIESVIKIWESCFIRNGGVLVPRGQNIHTVNSSCALKLALPLLSFAKINKCIYISSVLKNVWNRNWDAMNLEIKGLARDVEALRDSVSYSLDIINLWIDIISINNDAEKTSIRTPIFFLTCLFTSTLLISEYLYITEAWAHNYISNKGKETHLTTADRVLWLRAEKIFKKIEKNLLPLGSNNQSYSEFLRIQANGALDVDILDDEIARLALEPGDLKPIAEIILSGKLSIRCLSLGVRILADAPVWPIALLFAEALKARATHIHGCTNLWSPDSLTATLKK